MQIRNALITGAGTRLGRAMALALGEAGFDVAVHYRTSEEAARALAVELRAMGRTATTHRADLLDEDATRALLPAVARALDGPVTLLINNASIFDHDTLQTATLDSWTRHMGTNLRAPFVLTQALAAQAPAATTDQRGEQVAQALVVNMIDQRVRKLTPEFMTYTLAKWGLWGLTQTAAQALAPNVRVNAIGPGPTMQATRQSDAHFARQRAATVLQRGSNAQDVTAALLYLVNAPGVTGQLICTDGGQHLGWRTPDILGVEPPG